MYFIGKYMYFNENKSILFCKMVNHVIFEILVNNYITYQA